MVGKGRAVNIYDEPQGLSTGPIWFWLITCMVALFLMSVAEWWNNRR